MRNEPLADFRTTVNKKDAINPDIIKHLESAFPKAVKQTKQFCLNFLGRTDEQTARNVWDWLRYKIIYKKDDDNYQRIRLPGRMIADSRAGKGGGDCKSFALAANAILANLGFKTGFRYTSYAYGSTPTHVYCIASKNGKTFIVDGVYHGFNIEKPYSNKIDHTMQVETLSGLGTMATFQNNVLPGEGRSKLSLQQIYERMPNKKSFVARVVFKRLTNNNLTIRYAPEQLSRYKQSLQFALAKPHYPQVTEILKDELSRVSSGRVSGPIYGYQSKEHSDDSAIGKFNFKKFAKIGKKAFIKQQLVILYAAMPNKLSLPARLVFREITGKKFPIPKALDKYESQLMKLVKRGNKLLKKIAQREIDRIKTGSVHAAKDVIQGLDDSISDYELAGIHEELINGIDAENFDTLTGFDDDISGIGRTKKKRKGILKKIGKKLVHIVKATSLAIPRGAFMALVRLNVRSLATNLQKADQNKVKKVWEKLGGKWSSFQKVIAKGAKKKRLGSIEELNVAVNGLDPGELSGLGYVNSKSMGTAAGVDVAALLTSAAAVLGAFAKLFKKKGPASPQEAGKDAYDEAIANGDSPQVAGAKSAAASATWQPSDASSGVNAGGVVDAIDSVKDMAVATGVLPKKFEDGAQVGEEISEGNVKVESTQTAGFGMLPMLALGGVTILALAGDSSKN